MCYCSFLLALFFVCVDEFECCSPHRHTQSSTSQTAPHRPTPPHEVPRLSNTTAPHCHTRPTAPHPPWSTLRPATLRLTQHCLRSNPHRLASRDNEAQHSAQRGSPLTANALDHSARKVTMHGRSKTGPQHDAKNGTNMRKKSRPSEGGPHAQT